MGWSSTFSLRTVSVLVAVIWGLVGLFWAVVVHWEKSHMTEARREEVARERVERPSLGIRLVAWRVFARGVVIGIPVLFVLDGLLLRIGILYAPSLTLSTAFDRALQVAGIVISAAGLTILIVVGRTVSVKIYARATSERVLFTTGAHRHVRHPFYLHFVLLPVGLFLLTLNYLSISLLVLFSEIWEPKLLTTEIDEEEAELRRRFGRSYEEYANRTGKFFPRLRR